MVKGANESDYRTGNVNLTAENIGDGIKRFTDIVPSRNSVIYESSDTSYGTFPKKKLDELVTFLTNLKYIVNNSPTYNTRNNLTYRGKDITDIYLNGDLFQDISQGTFKLVYPGDYIRQTVTMNDKTVNECKWLVADIDYFYNDCEITAQDNLTKTHHIVLMPLEDAFGVVRMNGDDWAGGNNNYLGTEMWNNTLPNKILPGIIAAFGADHVLEHKEFLGSSVVANVYTSYVGTYGISSNLWYDCWPWQGQAWRPWITIKNVNANIPCSTMINDMRTFPGSSFDTYIPYPQFAALKYNKNLRYIEERPYWLRDRIIHDRFEYVTKSLSNDDPYPCIPAERASQATKTVRPYFCLY